MKINEATYNRPEGTRVLDAPYVVTDINASVVQLMNEAGWEKTDCNGITLFKTDNLTSVLICMHTGSRIGENSIDGTVTIQVVEGEVELTADEEVVTLHTGQMVMLHHEVTHSILATEETVMLLTNHVCC
jgi:quercetin dioxygenase-like cupin family protein